jgi:hypothetical protein
VNEKKYLIEVLLRARESISQVAQKAAKALDEVTKSQDKMSESSKRAAKAADEQRAALQQIHEARIREKRGLDDSAAALRSQARGIRDNTNALRDQARQVRASADALRAQRDAAVKATTESLREASALRDMARARSEQAGAIDKTAKQLTRQAEAARREADQNRRLASSYSQSIRSIEQRANALERDAEVSDRSARATDRQASAHERSSTTVSRSIASIVREISNLDNRQNTSAASATRFGRALSRVGIETGSVRGGLRGLNSELQGLQLALVVKYAQSLASVLVGLAGQLFAVATAAGQAAAGIAGALTAGVAQAVPVVGVLAAAFARLTSVLKAVKIQNQQQLTASHDAAAAARQQTQAADSIRNAEERVADAHRNTANAVQQLAQTRSDAVREEIRAQQEVTQAQQESARNITTAQQEVTRARKDAIRTVQDLISAEEQSQQTLEQAQASMRAAVRSGDINAIAQAQIDVGQARRGVTRARQDAAPVRARGVEGVDAVTQSEQRLTDVREQGQRQVLDAERRLGDVRRTNARQIESATRSLGDARRQEIRATDDLARTRRQAAEDLKQETAAADKLADSLKQLSPAERDLYRRILVLQEVYRRASRPITDIIVRAFSDVVDRITTLLQDSRILRGFRNIATQIAAAIRGATREAGGEQSIGAFQIITDEAARNIPIVARIITNLFRTARNLVLDAIPSFRLLLGYVDDYVVRLRDFVADNGRGLSNFFTEGVRSAKAFFDLGLAVLNLFLALAGSGGAADAGVRTVSALTRMVDGLTQKVRDNADSIRDFFERSRGVLFDVIAVIAAIGRQLIRVFDPGPVSALSDFLILVMIPALGNVIEILGALVTAFHQLFTLPGFAQFAQVVATMTLLASGLTIIRLAVLDVMRIIPNFLRAMGLMATAEEGVAAGFLGLTPPGWVILGITAVIAAIVLLNRRLHFLGPTLEWLKGAATDTFDWIKTAAGDVVSWFSDVWTQGLLYWIRYPFVQFIRWFGGQSWLNWTIRDFAAVVGWFAGPAWANLKAIIILPFEAVRIAFDVIWGAIQTIVVVALDVLSGRFERLGPHLSAIWGGIWDGIRSALVTALNALIDLVNSAVDAINKISPFGDIGHIQRISDNAVDAQEKVADATQKTADQYDKVGDKANENADRVDSSMQRIADATKKATSDSAKHFDQLFQSAHVSLRDIREVTENNMQDITSTLGDKSAEGKAALADNFRQAAKAVKKQMDAGEVTTRDGMRAIRKYLAQELQTYGLSLHSAQNIAKGNNAGGQYGDPDNNLGREGGASRAIGRAGGGMVSAYGGWPRDDHAVMDPYGRVSAYVSGNEGIVNPPQMDRINQWGSVVKGLGLDNYGSLQELWGMRGGGMIGGHSSKPRRFAAGGQIVPVPGFPGERAARSILDEIAWVARTFRGLILTDAYGQGHRSPGHTRTGTAADFSGPDRLMDAAVRALVSRGYLVGYDGRFGSQNWPGHGPSTRTPNFHFHVEFAGKQRDLGGAVASTTRIPRVPIRGGGEVGRVVQRTLDLVRASAQNRLDAAAGMSLTTPVGGGGARAMSPDANVVAAFRRAIRSTGATSVERLALWEAGIVESGLRNLNYGDADSLGALQERTSIYGRGHALNPFASAVRFLSDARRLRPWRGSAGMLAAALQRPAAQFRGRYDAVRGQAGRYLRGGGMLPRWQGGRPPVKGMAPIRQPTRGVATTGAPWLQVALAPVVENINGLFSDISEALGAVARGPLRRSKNLALRIQQAFERLTEDGGILDQLHDAVANIATRGALRLQQREFRIGAGGPQRATISDADRAQAQLQALQATGTGLGQERTSIRGGIAGAERAVAQAQRSNNAKAEALARAALTTLRERLDQNTADLAQNAQDQVEAVESFQQALLQGVNDTAQNFSNSLDRWARISASLGRSIDPNAILGQQIGNMQRQIGGLQGVLNQAVRTGNLPLAAQVRDQIDELNTQIAEAVAQQFQNSIDAVNNEAQRQTTRVDRAARRAQAGGVDYAALQATLGQRRGIMDTQRAGLQALMNQAAAAGNIDQFNNLADQIDELDTALIENTYAIRDNTDAAFNAQTQRVNDTFNFSQGVLSGAQGFFQALTERTGFDTMPQQLSALQGIAAALGTQQTGLLGQLATLTGANRNQLLGLRGQDLVNYLLSITSGPAFDAIMATLDPTQQQAFRDLVSGLLTSVTATEQNTKALQDLTGASTQAFSSSFWTGFRTAVFNGAGGLLPQYAMTIPTAAVGARVVNSGALMVHSGETVRPAMVSRDWGGDRGGDVYNLEITTPTEVLNPTDVGRQLAFYRKTSGR